MKVFENLEARLLVLEIRQSIEQMVKDKWLASDATQECVTSSQQNND